MVTAASLYDDGLEYCNTIRVETNPHDQPSTTNFTPTPRHDDHHDDHDPSWQSACRATLCYNLARIAFHKHKPAEALAYYHKTLQYLPESSGPETGLHTSGNIGNDDDNMMSVSSASPPPCPTTPGLSSDVVFSVPEEATGNTEQSPDRHHVRLATLLGISQLYHHCQQSHEAFLTAQKALSVALAHYSSDSLPVAACWHSLGVILSLSETKSAIDALHQSLIIRRAILGDAHAAVGTTHSSLGRAYSACGLHQRALHHFHLALQLCRTVLGPTNINVLASLFHLGQAHHQCGHGTEALSHYQEFLYSTDRVCLEGTTASRQERLRLLQRDVAMVWSCVGHLRQQQDQQHYPLAIAAFEEALRIGRQALGPAHPSIAVTLNKLGGLHCDCGDLDAAIAAYQEGLTVEQALPLDEPGHVQNVVVTLTNLIKVYQQKQDYTMALDCCQTMLVVQQRYATMPDSAVTLRNIGLLKDRMGDFAGALEAHRDCLQRYRAVHGDSHEDVAVTLTHIALVSLQLYEKDGRRHGRNGSEHAQQQQQRVTNHQDSALEAFLEAYRVRRTLEETRGQQQVHDSLVNARGIAFCLYNIGLLYHQRGQHHDALCCYRETARIEESHLGTQHPDLATTYSQMGQIHYQRGDTDLAQTTFQRVLQISTTNSSDNSQEDKTIGLARTLNELGNLALQRGDAADMVQCFSRALRIYRDAGHDDHELVICGAKVYRFDLVQPPAAACA